MKFDKILEYQNLDAELLKIEKQIKDSKEFREYYTLKGNLDSAAETILKLNNEAGDALASYDKLRLSVAEISAKLNELDDMNVEEIASLGEADFYDKQISGLLDSLAALEKELGRYQNKIEDIKNTSVRTMDQGKTLQAKLREAEKVFKEYRNSFGGKINELTNQMKGLEKEIQPEFLTAYVSLRKNRTVPAFVEYAKETQQCSRCFMNIPAETQGKLKNAGDFTECPNCRRILYIKD